MSRHRYRNSGPPFCKVFVGNLGSSGTQHELEDAFSYYGSLRNVWIARNPPGFAFVEFEEPNDALDAIEALDGSILCGCHVKVKLAHTNSRSSNRPPPSPERCYACGEIGHYARDCYQQNAVDSEDEIDPSCTERCYACGDIGHYARDCYQQNAANSEDEINQSCPDRCYVCGEIGHYARNCHHRNAVNSEDEIDQSFTDRCNACGEIGHDCYQQNAVNSEDEIDQSCPDRCYACGEIGHYARNCHQRNAVNSEDEIDQPYDRFGDIPELPHPETYEQNIGDRSWQNNWFNNPPQQRSDVRPQQQNRRNRTQQINWGPQREDRPLQQNRRNRTQQINWGPQREDRALQQNKNNRPAQPKLDDTLSQQKWDDTLSTQNRSDQSQQQNMSGSIPSHSSVSNKCNDASSDIKCVICLDTEDDPEMEYIPCGHSFHAKCCRDWLSINGICPVCRTSVAPESSTVQNNPERNTDDTPTFFIGSVWLS